jgi:hypothetical protein
LRVRSWPLKSDPDSGVLMPPPPDTACAASGEATSTAAAASAAVPACSSCGQVLLLGAEVEAWRGGETGDAEDRWREGPPADAPPVPFM